MKKLNHKSYADIMLKIPLCKNMDKLKRTLLKLAICEIIALVIVGFSMGFYHGFIGGMLGYYLFLGSLFTIVLISIFLTKHFTKKYVESQNPTLESFVK